MDLIEQLESSSPACLNEFIVTNAPAEIESKVGLGNTFIVKSVSCACGCEDLFLRVYKSEEAKGLFRKKMVASYWAPAYLKCPKCHTEKLIFDPRKHGWDGAMGENCSITEQGQLTSFSEKAGKVYVCYSFQGLENYEELVSEGVNNPQDYFDMFSFWFGLSPECVFEYECA